MPPNRLANGLASEFPFDSGERRKALRFGMHVPVLMRVKGDSWALGETVNLSTTGAYLLTDRPFLLNAPIHYVLTFPPDLTKTPQPLRLGFFGVVLRCERVSDSRDSFGMAVRSTRHRYLSLEASASFDPIEQKLLATSSSAATNQPRNSAL